jgi:hypothetical protein
VPSPVEAERYIRFQLEHLTARNEHHTFEEICYRIAKRRLSSNLLPATGPVSAGGDQGRDAETYYTRLPQEAVILAKLGEFTQALFDHDSAASHPDEHLRDIAWNRENAVLALGTAASLAQLIFARS